MHESVFDLVERRFTASPLEQHFPSVPSIANIEPWRTLAQNNSPGLLPPDLPLFIAQGTTDNLVRPQVTRITCGAPARPVARCGWS